jgi:hypothetical protein
MVESSGLVGVRRGAVALLVDAANLAIGLQARFGPAARLDMARLRARVIARFRPSLVAARVYLAGNHADRFLRRLEALGYMVRLAPHRGDDDVLLAHDLRALRFGRWRPERFIVGSGDGAFASIYAELVEGGCGVSVLGVSGTVSAAVRPYADVEYLDVEDLWVTEGGPDQDAGWKDVASADPDGADGTAAQAIWDLVHGKRDARE